MSLLASIQKTYPASLLLNFDGSFSDSSSYNHTITNSGANISSAQSKFGGSSGYFYGGWIETAASSSLLLGSADFTIEMWVYPNSLSAGQYYLRLDNLNAQNGVLIGNDGVSATTNGSSWDINIVDSATMISNCPLNTWTHLALVRKGSNFSFFANGIQIGSATNSGSINQNSPIARIGAANSNGGYPAFCYIDDLRITKGVALYQTNYFTPPSSSLSKNATIAPKLYNHIVMVSTKSSGDITGYVSTSSGYYTVNWWDGTKTTYVSGINFAKTSIGGNQNITIYPSTSDGSLGGYFYNVNVSNNNLTSVRFFYSRFIIIPGRAGYSQYGYFYNSYYSRGWRWNWIPPIPDTIYSLDVSLNLLDSSSLDQIYTDLLNGNGSIEVSDNTGVDSDSPSIATNKGYTVYGSLSPNVSSLFNFDSNFSDSGGNNVALTTYGTAAINTTIKKYGAGSAFFDTSGDYAQSALSTFFGFGKDDFTIEFWLYKLSDGGYFHGIVCIGTYANGILFRHQPGGDPFYLAGDYYDWNATTNCPYNQWTHIAIVRKNGYFSVYANGSKVLSGYNDADLGSTATLTIGASSHNVSEGLNGYIDGLKIVKGKALYTGDFVVPSSAPTTSTSSVSAGVTRLLLNFIGTNNSTVFADSSSSNHTVTAYGNAKISTTQSKPSGGSSGYFDGTGDYLDIPYNTVFNLSSGSWTLEAWFYATSLPSDMTTASSAIISKDVYGSSFDWNINVAQNGIVFLCNNVADSNSVFWCYTSISTNAWHHIAIVSDGLTCSVYFDGTLVSSKVFSGSFIMTNATSDITIGCNASNSPNSFFTGYIDDVRIIKGKALYTSNFTPPTSQLTNYP